jgi:hypothetical protein
MITSERTKKLLCRSFAQWMPWAIALTLVFLAIYGVNQQALRQSANDPQIQMAEDTAAAIGAAEPVSFFNSPTKIDISKSLAPYLVIYDANGAIAASTGMLNGAPLMVPKGVLQSALAGGEDRVTWQPQPGVRSAIVVVPIKGIVNGFVVAGRSLRETENREDQIGAITFAAWFISLIAMLIIFFLMEILKDKTILPK